MFVVVSHTERVCRTKKTMRRLFFQMLGILVLLAGPTYPYVHLAAVPHRYCPIHGTFEKVPYHYNDQGHRVPDKPLGGDEDDEHEKCFVAALTLTALHNSDQTILVETVASSMQQARNLVRPLATSVAILAVAPKSSPPTNFS